MINVRISVSIVAVAALLVLGSATNASDIASDVRSGASRQAENGGYFELGFIAGYANSPWLGEMADDVLDDGGFVGIDATGEFRRNGFFLEATQGTQDGLNIGYSIWQNEAWTLDLLTSMNGFYDTENDTPIHHSESEASRNKKLDQRNTLYMGTGVRVSHYIGDYVLQYRLLTDILSNNGVMSTLRVGRGWQYRNWNFHGIASAEYASATTNDYWFGVDDDIATDRYPAYRPDSGMSYSLRLGVVKPLSEKWVFRAYAGWAMYSSAARDSAYLNDSNSSFIALTVNRVFSKGN